MRSRPFVSPTALDSRAEMSNSQHGYSRKMEDEELMEFSGKSGYFKNDRPLPLDWFSLINA